MKRIILRVLFWIVAIACIGYLAGFVCAMLGCEAGASATVTPGTTTITEHVKESPPSRIVTEVVRPDPRGGPPTTTTTTQEVPPVREVTHAASSSGPGATVRGQKLEAGLTGTPAELKLPGGGSATGGGFGFDASASAATARLWAAVALGGLMLLGSAGCFYLNLRRPATILAGLGIGFLAVGLWPMLLVWAAVAGVLVLAVWAVYESHNGRNMKESLRAGLQAAYSLPTGARRLWEAGFRNAADRTSDVVVAEKIAKDDGLHAIAASPVAIQEESP